MATHTPQLIMSKAGFGLRNRPIFGTLNSKELSLYQAFLNSSRNADQKRKRVRKGGGAPCTAVRTERREALFIFGRELPIG
ncbi:hypothetical protein A2W24_03075 [Microgenomates group bacterium RBG_16_45_19]|nr:MAG: hypothetical protein A2W24_03075 [Microgenomates group bacterium RBG_16_45_19]